MALKLNERYPGRFNNPSAGYPQGSFKNRTTPTAKDGSYLEKDWANDKEGFFQSLLATAVIAANGSVDSVGSSQYFDALRSVIRLTGTSWSMITNTPTTIAGYGIIDAYTKTQIDSSLLLKANKATTLTGYGITDAIKVGDGGFMGPAPTRVGTLSSIPSSQFFTASSPTTTDGPVGQGQGVGIHLTNSNTQFSVDLFNSINTGIPYMGYRINYTSGVTQWYSLWDSNNFNPTTKLNGDYATAAGFVGGAIDSPYIKHSSATDVRLATKAYVDANLGAATETVSGIVKMSTAFLANGGADNTTAMSPAKVASRIAAGLNTTLGFNRTYVDATASRSSGVSYTNNAGAPIQVLLSLNTLDASETTQVVVQGVTIYSGDPGVRGQQSTITFIVPNSASYSVTLSGTTIQRWVELI
ncbi:hypothetical protein [Pseudomonas sp. O11]|uniref:hypothetical protein n=1 Tax=Pseudomonas sp. O11 TaxID=3159446 RepID=UPI00387B4B6D